MTVRTVAAFVQDPYASGAVEELGKSGTAGCVAYTLRESVDVGRRRADNASFFPCSSPCAEHRVHDARI